MKKLLILSTLFLLGCNNINILNFNSIEPSESTSVLIVGVEDGKYGKCQGSLYDAVRMNKLLSNYTKNVTMLTNNLATVDNFSNSFNKMIDSELVILYYSGHGGSRFGSDSTELDGYDEYLCLYDNSLLDDDIWKLICKCKGRVFLIFDCCHSETMFRTPGIFLNKYSRLISGTSNVNMLCWSGCPDNSYSYGSARGGEFTNTILDYYKSKLTYDKLWIKLANDKSLKSSQDIKCTKLGDFNINELIFK